MATVLSPNPNFDGRIGSVQFTAGSATVDPVAQKEELRYFERKGFGIDGPVPTPPPIVQGPPQTLFPGRSARYSR